MTRVQFTAAITKLLSQMVAEGESPLIDYCLRSLEEQQRLFALHRTKCDGIVNASAHQFGKAMDIYLIKDGRITDGVKGHEYWHKQWEQLGGKPMISWDRGHYEVP